MGFLSKIFGTDVESQKGIAFQDIQKLIDLTTIVKVSDNTSRVIIFGDEYYVDRFQQAHLHGFQDKQHYQTDLSDLEKYWENKWQSFGNLWSEKRQNYRFLYDSFRLFCVSFQQMKLNKELSITTGDNHKEIHFNELSGASLYGMYHHGKKCIDLLVKLKLLINHPECDFIKKFSETRNKLIEHNHNPYDSKNRQVLNLQIEPYIWSLINTNSLLEVAIHKPNQERAFDVYVDCYEDYFKLEEIIADIVETF